MDCQNIESTIYTKTIKLITIYYKNNVGCVGNYISLRRTFKMTITQTVHCPNCGARATQSISQNQIKRTSCPSCDYLLVQCAKTARVIEAYAPGVKSYCSVEFASA